MTESTPAVVATPRRWRKPPRLYEEIARDLADAIARGAYGPGDFLPTEQILVGEYGASRNVIREALKLLSARGMVEVLHGRGSRVLPAYRWQLLDQLVRVVREDPRVPQDLLELRRILEMEIAGLAAERASAEQIEALRHTLEQMREASERPEECIEHDIRFHRLLAEAAGNALLPIVLEPVGRLLRAARLMTIRNPGVIDHSISGHEEIITSVAARDRAGAAAAMGRHLLGVEAEIRRTQTGLETDLMSATTPV